MKVAIILPAAGASSRFGPGEKKPFTNLDGRAIWQRSAELFWTRDEVYRVYIVISPDDRELFERRYRPVVAFANASIVDGGRERFESVANALNVVPEEVDFVCVHDAVRPLCPPACIDAVFSAASRHGAAMLAIPLQDTLKRVESGGTRIVETVPRADLWCAQTPQVFRRDWLVEAYANRTEVAGPITDDAQLIEAIGHAVHVVHGSPSNLKITTRDDLELAEAVLASRISKSGPKTSRPFDDAAW